jgi:DNA-binding NarL/FixJ family response regulator
VSIKVLIVEDDPVFRDAFVQAIAQALDMTLVGEAATLAQGLALLALQPEVLLVDLQLPDGHGIDLIHAATQRLPDCEIMVVTVFGDEGSVLDSIAAGATGYLLKDLTAAEIIEHVRELRAGGSPISPVIARQLLNQLPRDPRPLPAADEVSLSDQEIRVLGFAAKGFSYDEIAALMNVSRHSVQTYVKRAYRKLQVHTKVEALAEARRLQLLG